ncbi:SIR2 family protein [Undibacterium sp. CY18W]|uniref:SIR2 family protein n=1 Tax=Undibacterium hunanense TaxID=2762292 RepID=A0ABR6ZQX7_9BURK|nr:SIR2 family protein [Undibacterium hunanense]MBC3918295.1 SIR2 family protein [Undibacterium hunanense]
MTKLNDLSDYPAIKKLAAALHKFDASQRGAAIIIGAGFSRSSATHIGGEKKIPLWFEFTKKLVAELSPNSESLDFSDPMRVAEEYRAYFGQTALNDKIRAEIDDEAWIAGVLYDSLLKLPWSEIMTTNWDTLLERASEKIHGPYYTSVTKAADLAWAPSPRIVKLHGTIGVTDTFIAAQEDYRTYPTKFAPFVNFARQVFIENELCLLGFSGDDPNFLQWAGWVRDQLAGHARKIFLVGAFNLSAARRKHLESINISPIDLWDAVKEHSNDRDLMHKVATELFLSAMKNEGDCKAKPHEWKPHNLNLEPFIQELKNHKTEETEFIPVPKELLETLKTDRESYPGWLVCPPKLLWRVKDQLLAQFLNQKNLIAFSPNDGAKLLYEVAWRYGITFEYIAPWLEKALFRVTDSHEQFGLSKQQQYEIILVLLKNSRWHDSESEEEKTEFQQYVQTLINRLKQRAQYYPDVIAEIAYNRAITARDALNYSVMSLEVEKIAGEDPVWKLRKAAILMELGRFEEGTQLIAKSYGELRETYRRDRHSIPVLSRLLWAHWLMRWPQENSTIKFEEELPAFAESTYRKWNCDPWVWIDHVKERVLKRQENYLEKKNPITPSFQQGHYRDNSNQITLSNETSEILLLEGLKAAVGIPLRSGSSSGSINLLTDTVDKLLQSGEIHTQLWDYILAIHSASNEDSPSIKSTFTRMGIACAPKNVVDELVIYILKAVEFWNKQRIKEIDELNRHSLSVLRVLMEVLARLVIRVTPEKAKELFNLSIRLRKTTQLQHFYLIDIINSITVHSLNSIPNSERWELLADTLEIPLKNEFFSDWPNIAINHLKERNTYIGLEKHIDELIEAVAEKNPTRTAAILRLFPLVKKDGFLTEDEHTKLANAIWGDAPDYTNLPDVNLFPHAFLILPSPDKEKVKALVYNFLYKHEDEILSDTQKDIRRYPSPEITLAVKTYFGIAHAANKNTNLYPMPEDAQKLFDRLVIWRPQKVESTLFNFIGNSQSQLIDSISNALSYGIVPALTDEQKCINRFESLLKFYQEVEDVFYVLPAFAYFASKDQAMATVTEKTIRKALRGQNVREVGNAASTLMEWAKLPMAQNSSQLKSLISILIDIIESGRIIGLQRLIWVAGELFKRKFLFEEQITTLIEAISNIFYATDYADIEPHSKEAIGASTIRESCVNVANILVKEYPDELPLQNLLKDSHGDALPEVRFATDSYES